MNSNEAALVFDHDGNTIHLHTPPDASGCYLPDSQDLWEVLWANRKILGGVAHTHPWAGEPIPSGTDVTTWHAIEKGLGRKLWWPIVTLDQVGYFYTTKDGYRKSSVWARAEFSDQEVFDAEKLRSL